MAFSRRQKQNMLRRANSFLNDGKFLHAIQVYYKILMQDRRCVRAYLDLASLYLKNGCPESAISILTIAGYYLPHNADIISRLCSLYINLGNYENALHFLDKLSGNNFPLVHFQRGLAYFYSKRFEEAEYEFQQTLELDKHFPCVNELIGEVLIKRGDFFESIKYLKRELSNNPYCARTHYLLGIAYNQLGDLQCSYDEFAVATDLDPTEPIYWQMCGEVLFKLSKYKLAKQCFNEAIKLKPDFIESMIYLYRIALLHSDRKSQCKWLARISITDPSNILLKEQNLYEDVT